MKLYRYPNPEDYPEILSRPLIRKEDLMIRVQAILNDVKKNGDEALKRYTLEFDGIEINDFEVCWGEISTASNVIDDDLREAIDQAMINIGKFHTGNMLESNEMETMPGVKCWQKTIPIEKVGLYIPGGSAPLISTVLMLGIPALIAGCSEVILCTPPDKDGMVHPAILYAAYVLGINQVFRVGGVQAIAAMAYGTESIPAVYKIFGPGNQYVTMAKQLVNLDGVAIDMPAGPSEVAIVADKSANPGFIASDLLAQAEHGLDSQVMLITDYEPLIERVEKEIKKQLRDLPRKEIAEEVLRNNRVILVPDQDEMLRLINAYAPEHLIIMTDNYMELAGKVRNAGSVFLGSWSPVSAGDYASGTNHTLPTNGAAKAYSGVTTGSFSKTISFQEISRSGLKDLGPVIDKLAEAEGLDAHRNSVSIRLVDNK